MKVLPLCLIKCCSCQTFCVHYEEKLKCCVPQNLDLSPGGYLSLQRLYHSASAGSRPGVACLGGLVGHYPPPKILSAPTGLDLLEDQCLYQWLSVALGVVTVNGTGNSDLTLENRQCLCPPWHWLLVPLFFPTAAPQTRPSWMLSWLLQPCTTSPVSLMHHFSCSGAPPAP